MTQIELLEYLKSEENKAFKGWDFSYLNGRWESESLPWDYFQIIKKYLKDDMSLLDIGTGGGEFLLKLNHPFNLTTVTEAYPPNIKLCNETLTPLGITVVPVTDYHHLDIADHSTDIVIDRHEEFDFSEVKRILKPGGIMITQQVGSTNNYDLVSFFNPNHTIEYPNVELLEYKKKCINQGFEILYENEYHPKLRFYDVGAIAYFAKIVPWEFGSDFSAEKYIHEFETLHKLIQRNHYIESTEHRFILVIRNHK